MELTRRDALVAAMGGGLGLSGGAVLASVRSGSSRERSVSTSIPDSQARGSEATGTGERLATTFVAVARAIYPSNVEGVGEFVRTYVTERFTADSGGDREAVTATRELDAFAEGTRGRSVVDLEPGAVEELLVDIGVDGAAADPAGTVAQRVRYYVVNELQYALYASPTGGKLAGIENPIGYPGGTTSYRRGPSA